jgi:hypothetical protein
MTGSTAKQRPTLKLFEDGSLKLDALWLAFFAAGGDANILELGAYIHHELTLSDSDKACLEKALDMDAAR